MITNYMTKTIITVGKEDSLILLLNKMTEHRLSGIPVTNEDQKLLGFAPGTEILDRILPDFIKSLPANLGTLYTKDFDQFIKSHSDDLKKIKVKDIMIKPSYILYENSSFIEAIKIFVEKKINRIAVLNEKEELIGILCRNNILSALLKKITE